MLYSDFLVNCNHSKRLLNYELNITNLELQNNYWRETNTSVQIFFCPKRGACRSDNKSLVGDAICSEGFTGPVCGVCMPDYPAKLRQAKAAKTA